MNTADKHDPLKDYKKDSKGKYVYSGKLYRIKLSDRDIKELFKRYWFCIALLFVMWIIKGLLPFRGVVYALYCVIPFCLELICILMFFRGTITFSSNKKEMKERQHRKSIENFAVYGVVMLISLAASIITSTIYVLINGFAGDQLYFILYIVVTILMSSVTSYFNTINNKLEFNIINASDKINE